MILSKAHHNDDSATIERTQAQFKNQNQVNLTRDSLLFCTEMELSFFIRMVNWPYFSCNYVNNGL